MKVGVDGYESFKSGPGGKVRFLLPVFFLLAFMFFPPSLAGSGAIASAEVSAEAFGETPENIRVGISLVGNGLEFSLKNGYNLVSPGEEEPLPLLAGHYSLTCVDDRIEISATQDSFCTYLQGPLLLLPAATSETLPADQFFQLHNALYGSEYRGALEVIPADGALVAVNIIDLESYLRGVLPGEMPAAWGGSGGFEALKAQAVAARTYALYNLQAHRHSMYHLCDQQHCQVYRGRAAESPYTDRALKETAGEILTFKGQLIEPFYHASNGGYTELSQNVWPEQRPYLASVPDPYDDPANPLGLPAFICCPRWTVDLTPHSLGEQLASRGSYTGEVQHVEIVSSFASGRVNEIIVYGRGGRSVSITKENARIMLGLESQLFTVCSAPQSQLWVASADYNRQNKESILELKEKWVLDGHNIKSRLSGDRFFASGGRVQGYIPAAGLVFQGQGRGHGVGLSQYGAYNRSRAGQSCGEILSFYYPGAEVAFR
ncbi:MAG: SpoIID/LytB domain-containing protein [Firmicutes bacterium]|nr:SpoIID/LytB domain-containing protein [Bacillota bacterium]